MKVSVTKTLMCHRHVNDALLWVDKNRVQWIFIYEGSCTEFQIMRWCANFV